MEPIAPWSRLRSRRLGALRDRIVLSARFQRAAGRWPGLRLVARRRARRVFDLCAGFVYSQIVAAAVELGLFETLARAPTTESALASELGLEPDVLRRLLRATIALELVEQRRGGLYGLGTLGAAIASQPAVVEMIRHHAKLYVDLADPVALLRGERASAETASFWPYADRSQAPQALAPERVADYSRLMSATQPLIAEQVLAAHRIGRHRALLDVGGGEGTFLLTAAAHAPHLELGLFDLPSVAERAARRFAAIGESRFRVHGGDFFRDPLPRGYDAISLVRILHDHDDDRVRILLANVRSALPPGGTLIVAEPLSGTAGAEPVGDAYFAFYLLAMGSGRARTREELTAMLAEAGFERVKLERTGLPLQTSVLVARAR